MKKYLKNIQVFLPIAGFIPAIGFTADDYLAGLGDKPSHDTSFQDVTSGLGSFSQSFVSVLAIVATVLGVFLFFLCLWKMRKQEEAGQAIVGMVVASLLCIALTLFGLLTGIVHWFASGSG